HRVRQDSRTVAQHATGPSGGRCRGATFTEHHHRRPGDTGGDVADEDRRQSQVKKHQQQYSVPVRAPKVAPGTTTQSELLSCHSSGPSLLHVPSVSTLTRMLWSHHTDTPI